MLFTRPRVPAWGVLVGATNKEKPDSAGWGLWAWGTMLTSRFALEPLVGSV